MTLTDLLARCALASLLVITVCGDAARDERLALAARVVDAMQASASHFGAPVRCALAAVGERPHAQTDESSRCAVADRRNACVAARAAVRRQVA